MGYDVPATDEDIDGREEQEGSIFDEYSPEELVLYRQYIRNIFNKNDDYDDHKKVIADEWIKDLEMGCSDAQVALILISCPNIHSLYFETTNNQRHFMRVIQLAEKPIAPLGTSLQPPLSRLRHIYIESHESLDVDHEEINIDRSPGHFLKLPGLRSFEGVNVRMGDDVGWWFQKLPVKFSSLQDIALRRSYVSPRRLQGMLGACKAVKRLEITRGFHGSSVEELLPQHVLRAILPHAESLEILHFNMAEEWHWSALPSEHELSYMGTELHKMIALKRLTTGMCSVTALSNGDSPNSNDDASDASSLQLDGPPRLIDCLPDNLEYLEIHRSSELILDQIQQLILTIQEGHRFRKLKHVKLLLCDTDPDKIQLNYDPSIVHIELISQSIENRIYDLIPAFNQGNHRVDAICSPIHSPDLRAQWLDIRGNNTGFASTDFELYEAPGIKLSQEKPHNPRPAEYLPSILATQTDEYWREVDPEVAALREEYAALVNNQNQP
ncbi:unnamed protein product [Clonostachys byssicola]|uniref:Uncharacterized protein n=1 Tax=Clonostachys byssicola TaxID=160290 RepID=A0A9N9UAK3_9HYPO|nr:unnamed protein product [Clonostachys byssicola]